MLHDFFERVGQHEPTSLTGSAILALSLLFPVISAVALWVWLNPNRKQRGAIALATTWNAVWLLAFNVVAVQVGWWEFHNAGPTLVGIPVVLWLSWTVLWGTVAGAAVQVRAIKPAFVIAVLIVFDLIYMPLIGEVVSLGPRWLVGEAVLLIIVGIPGVYLAQWTGEHTAVVARSVLQVVMFSGILLWFVPLLSVAAIGRELKLDVPTWAYGAVLFAVGGAALPAVTAIYDFVLNGGTPWPWDTTDRPVRSGPYRYVRSPMQASAMLVLVAMAFTFGEPIIAAAVVSAALYGRLFCQLEAADLGCRFGSAWTEMALDQRRWIPRWSPHPEGEEAVLWVNYGCDICAPIANFLQLRGPVNLTLRPATEHPDALERLRYERGDGGAFDGHAAVGAALEHLTLGWAMVGWLLRLPVLTLFWRLIADAVGFGPRPVEPLRNQDIVNLLPQDPFPRAPSTLAARVGKQ